MLVRALRLTALLIPCACSAPMASTPPTAPPPPDLAALRIEVWDTELAFADTMAMRDHGAFASFVSEEAVFLSGGEPLRGRAAVATGWAPLFESPEAPFSWAPDTVEVLASGTLALSSGPVRSPTGAQTGRFTSIWRLEPEGWKVIFDRGDGN